MLDESQNPVSIANTVSLARGGMSGPVLVVEGELDVSLYKKFTQKAPHSRIVFCRGKRNLLEVMRILTQRRIDGALGICDADFDRILSITPADGIVFADHHDAEIMMAYSDAFGMLMSEMCRTVPLDEVSGVRDSLMDSAAAIGRIRLWNKERNGRLSFKDADPGSFLGPDLNFDMAAYSAKVLELSGRVADDVNALVRASSDHRAAASIPDLAVGHDLMSLLDSYIAIKNSRARLGEEIVGPMLRLAFDAASFRKTDLAREITAWEANSGFELLSDDAQVI
jgi:hypothetical protein